MRKKKWKSIEPSSTPQEVLGVPPAKVIVDDRGRFVRATRGVRSTFRRRLEGDGVITKCGSCKGEVYWFQGQLWLKVGSAVELHSYEWCRNRSELKRVKALVREAKKKPEKKTKKKPPKVRYEEYINSEEWFAFRRRWFTETGITECVVCGSIRRPGFHLHHRSYERLGREELEDIVLMCPPCHGELHEAFVLDSGPLSLTEFTDAWIAGHNAL